VHSYDWGELSPPVHKCVLLYLGASTSLHVWVDNFCKVPVILYDNLQHRLHQLRRQLQITCDKMSSSVSHGSKSVSNDSCSDLLVVVYFHRSYRITHPLDMESGYNNTECLNNYNIWDFSAI